MAFSNLHSGIGRRLDPNHFSAAFDDRPNILQISKIYKRKLQLKIACYSSKISLCASIHIIDTNDMVTCFE